MAASQSSPRSSSRGTLHAAILSLLILICLAETQRTFTICIPLSIGRTKPALHAYYSVEYFAARQSYPGVTFRAAMVGNNGGDSTSVRDAVGAWVRDGVGSCDAVIGPSRSSVSTALSPLIRVPWMSWGSTSTALSDKASHPSFSRAVPTDDVGGGGLAVLMVRRFGWQRASVVFVDDSYGRSVASGVATRMRALGGSIALSIASPDSDDEDKVRVALSAVERTGSRIIVIAGIPINVGFRTLLRVIQQDRLAERGYIFVFSEAACTTEPPAFLQVPGSFCMPYIVDQSRMTPFTAFYEDDVLVSAKRAVLRTTGMRDDLMEVTGTDILSAFAHEATQHVMAALNATKAEGTTFEQCVAVLRSIETPGVTGTVSLDENGDRISVSMQVLNARPDNTSIWFATVEGDTIRDGPDAAETLFVSGVGFTDTIPKDSFETVDDEGNDFSTLVVFGIVCGLNIVSLVVLAFVKSRNLKKKQRMAILQPRTLVVAGKIIFHVADMVTDLISASVVVQRPESTLTFKTLFCVLVGLGLIASAREFLAVLQFFVAILTSKRFTASQLRRHEDHVARTESLSFIMEDLPMLIMTTVAINQKFDFFLLVSVFLTSIVTGMKTAAIRDAVQSYLAPESVTLKVDEDEKADSTNPAMQPQSNSAASPELAAQIMAFRKERDALLESYAHRLVFEMDDEGVTVVEMFSVVMPFVRQSYVLGGASSDSDE